MVMKPCGIISMPSPCESAATVQSDDDGAAATAAAAAAAGQTKSWLPANFSLGKRQPEVSEGEANTHTHTHVIIPRGAVDASPAVNI